MTPTISRLASAPLMNRGCEMKQLMMTIFFAGLGFWIGTHRLVPLWLIVVMGGLGVVCWLVAEWMERKERREP